MYHSSHVLVEPVKYLLALGNNAFDIPEDDVALAETAEQALETHHEG